MSYIGANKIGGMYLGSTEIAKAYLGSTLVYQKSGVTPVLPYDAEVAYLRSSGTQYIDTGIKPNKDTRIKVTYSIVMKSTIFPFGVRDSGNAGDAKNGVFRTHGNANRVGFGNGNGTNYNVSGNNDGYTTYEVFFDKNQVYINGNLVATLPTSDWSSSFDFFLFGIDTGGNFQSAYAGETTILSCQIWNDTTFVRDYIPVRVGSVGYLYDKVSRTLYGNNGTNSFTIGNDIT